MHAVLRLEHDHGVARGVEALKERLAVVGLLGRLGEERGGQLAGVADHDHGLRVVLERDERRGLDGLRSLVDDDGVELEAGDAHHHLEDGLRARARERAAHHLGRLEHALAHLHGAGALVPKAVRGVLRVAAHARFGHGLAPLFHKVVQRAAVHHARHLRLRLRASFAGSLALPVAAAAHGLADAHHLQVLPGQAWRRPSVGAWTERRGRGGVGV